MTDFHFLRPWWLLALPCLAALLWLMRRRRWSGAGWRDFCDPGLLPHVLISSGAQGGQRPLLLAALAGGLAVLALAGPSWERLPSPVFRNLSALVVVLDLSLSMDATDLKPSRVERARYKIADILRERKDGQTALVVYAGDAFTVTPLTDDSGTIEAQLSALTPELMPVQGNRADLGMNRAEVLLRQAGLRGGDVLLVASAGGEAEAANAAGKLRASGYRVSVLGVGTEEGAPVRLPQGGFLKDEHGQILVPRLEAAALRQVAEAGGGLYQAITPGNGDLRALLGFFERQAVAQEQSGPKLRMERWQDRGAWLVPLLLPLAALGFRRGWVGGWLLLGLLPLAPQAEAFEWRDLWLTRDQQAERDLRAGRPEQAAERFRNPEWKAAAEYRAGRFGETAKTLQGLDTADAQYNRGNALAREGHYPEALAAYDRALRLEPGDEDARYNKELVEQALKRQQQDQKQQGQQGQNEKNQQGQQNQKRPENQQQGQQNQENQQGQQDPNQQIGQKGQEGGQPQQGGSEAQPSSPDGMQEPQRKPGDQDGQQARQDENAGKEQRDESAPENQAGKEKSATPEPAGMAQEKPEHGKTEAAAPSGESEAALETRQAEEQWLRRIPDDPGGLLKRKFYYQYRQRQQQNSERDPW